MSFKVGDRIRVIKNNHTDSYYNITKPGSIGTVTRINLHENIFIIVFDKKDLTSSWDSNYQYYASISELDNFELVRSSPKTHLPDFL